MTGVLFLQLGEAGIIMFCETKYKMRTRLKKDNTAIIDVFLRKVILLALRVLATSFYVNDSTKIKRLPSGNLTEKFRKRL